MIVLKKNKVQKEQQTLSPAVENAIWQTIEAGAMTKDLKIGNLQFEFDGADPFTESERNFFVKVFEINPTLPHKFQKYLYTLTFTTHASYKRTNKISRS